MLLSLSMQRFEQVFFSHFIHVNFSATNEATTTPQQTEAIQIHTDGISSAVTAASESGATTRKFKQRRCQLLLDVSATPMLTPDPGAVVEAASLSVSQIDDPGRDPLNTEFLL